MLIKIYRQETELEDGNIIDNTNENKAENQIQKKIKLSMIMLFLLPKKFSKVFLRLWQKPGHFHHETITDKALHNMQG